MTSPDTSPAPSSAALGQTLAKLRRTEASCLDTLAKMERARSFPRKAVKMFELRIALGKMQARIPVLEAEISKAVAVELERDNPYLTALERQHSAQAERAARKGALQTFAGDRDADEPRFIGFDEPAIVPVEGG